MGRLYQYIIKISEQKKGITFLFLIFLFVVLPMMSFLNTFISKQSLSFDTNFLFHVDQYYTIRNSLGENGRLYYIFERFTFDLIWPVVYTLFFLSLAQYIHLKNKKKVIVVLSFSSIIFDYLENIFAVIFVLLYPSTAHYLIYMLMIFTILKWCSTIFVSIYFTVAILVQKKSSL